MTSTPLSRDVLLEQARAQEEPWDVIVIGGGATGVGIAVDAASRGYSTLLLEQHDFGKGTSSRSTKLAHGGVRYLRQGNISLVRAALRERGLLAKNAPHLVTPLPFLIPTFGRWEQFYYRCGLKVYDMLAGVDCFPSSTALNAKQACQAISTLRDRNLRGGVIYYDGLFDDARLLINLVQTAIEGGAVCLNYVRVDAFDKQAGRIAGVIAEDVETGQQLRVSARVVINATGPFVDKLRQQDDNEAVKLIAPSQGIHLVVDASFLGGETALIVPKTRDGRVMFAIPWHGRTLIGTTDTTIDKPSIEPIPLADEIDFLLETSADYFDKPPQRADVLSVFAGIRPLVQEDSNRSTSKLSRDHTILTSDSQLITITGGKWTTYREMAQQCVDVAAKIGGLKAQSCVTENLRVHGANDGGSPNYYGSDADSVEDLIASNVEYENRLDDALPYRAGDVVWSARCELARSVEDVLSRRTRALLLDAAAAVAAAPQVARLLAAELGKDDSWQQRQIEEFINLAEHYQI